MGYFDWRMHPKTFSEKTFHGVPPKTGFPGWVYL